MPSRSRPPGVVRIIGGRWKRSVLPVPDAPGLRPTPDRVRETVFNWLAHALGSFDGRRVLDLFAGSGALGFEAASRGAARVILVERSASVAARLRETADRLAAANVEIMGEDALAAARRLGASTERFDVVFLDPPFGSDLLAPALATTIALATMGGLVYVESGAALSATVVPAGWESYRADRAGDVFYYLLQRKKTA